MKLSLQLILETLTEYGAQLLETDGDFAFTGVQILTSPTDILEPDTLYVCTPKVLPKLKKQLFENHCFVFKAKPSQLQCHHALHGILLDENTDLNEVVNRLITLFTQFHAFEFAIKEASLERRGYEPFFEIAKKAFPHCLIVVTDSAYNIVCSTRSSVDDIPYFRDLLQRGYYSREDMNQIASFGYYEDERKCVQPVLYPAEKTICGYPFLVRSYKNHGAAYCFIGCYFLDVPPTQRDISLYTCLTQELENYYKVNGIFDAGMLGKQQQLLDDLIRPKQNSPEYFHDRCAQLNIPYQGTFRIGLVQCESSTLFKLLAMTCEDIDAQEAARIRLVERVVPLGELEQTTLAYAEKLAAKPPIAVQMCKKCINIATDAGTSVGLLAEEIQGIYTVSTKDKAEAAAAMLEKRPGRYTCE